MTTLFAKSALLPEGWADNVIVEIDKAGWIAGVDSFKKEPAAGDADIVQGPLVPGIPNAHSHTFQRAMAGMAERAGGRKENFWSWRDTMYRFTAQLSPDDMEHIAAQGFVEMLKAGYTSVGEFHYIHHRQDGRPFDDPAHMSLRIVRAALDAGISITHMPALYAHGGFGALPPTDAQKRFVNDPQTILRVIEELHGEFRTAEQVTVGLAHHSLRAVSPGLMKEATEAFRALLKDAPVHILAAGQQSEVEGCLAWSGKRPLRWLLDSGLVDENWTFVYATHADRDELKSLAASGIIAALCPTSSANLGEGVFPLLDYFTEGGAFAIGSDSNISISATGELRWLEYLQRLSHGARTLVSRPDVPSVGATLFEKAVEGGAKSLGRKTGRIAPGYRADLVVLDDSLPAMANKIRDHLLDAAIFAADESPVRDVMSGGRWAVQNRRHRKEDHILENYRKVLSRMR